MDTRPALLTTREVAELFRVSPASVSAWAKEGLLPAVRIPGTKNWRFRREDIERLLAAGEQPEAARA